MLYFREEETKKLRLFSKNPHASAMAIYGRRRTGKTALVLNFLSEDNHPRCIYFQCASQNYTACLKDFTASLQTLFPESSTILSSLHHFREVFQYLAQTAKEPTIFIIDEFPFLAKKHEDAVTEFQWIIDHCLATHKLILMGSSLSFMKHQIQSREAPLYGRFHDILEIRPFSFQQVSILFPTFEDAVQVYGQTGGVAQYVMFFTEYTSVSEATDALFLNRDGRMFQEAGNLLMQELRDVSTYISILRGIGVGERTTAQISEASDLDSRALYPYLNKLMELELVSIAENPLSSSKRETRYRISDLFFRFHYSFIEPNISMITAIGPSARDYIFHNKFSEYLGLVYAEIIRSSLFVYALEGKIPFMPVTVGKWWGAVCENGIWGTSEVDVIAYNDHQILIGECKYKTKQMGLKELHALQAKIQFIPCGKRKIICLLASKSGFTKELYEAADQDVILITQA